MTVEIDFKSAILEKVQEVADERLGPGIIKVVEDTPLFDSKILNSYKLLELVEFIEHELGVEIEEEDLSTENFESVNILLKILQ